MLVNVDLTKNNDNIETLEIVNTSSGIKDFFMFYNTDSNVKELVFDELDKELTAYEEYTAYTIDNEKLIPINSLLKFNINTSFRAYTNGTVDVITYDKNGDIIKRYEKVKSWTNSETNLTEPIMLENVYKIRLELTMTVKKIGSNYITSIINFSNGFQFMVENSTTAASVSSVSSNQINNYNTKKVSLRGAHKAYPEVLTGESVSNTKMMNCDVAIWPKGFVNKYPGTHDLTLKVYYIPTGTKIRLLVYNRSEEIVSQHEVESTTNSSTTYTLTGVNIPEDVYKITLETDKFVNSAAAYIIVETSFTSKLFYADVDKNNGYVNGLNESLYHNYYSIVDSPTECYLKLLNRDTDSKDRISDMINNPDSYTLTIVEHNTILNYSGYPTYSVKTFEHKLTDKITINPKCIYEMFLATKNTYANLYGFALLSSEYINDGEAPEQSVCVVYETNRKIISNDAILSDTNRIASQEFAISTDTDRTTIASVIVDADTALDKIKNQDILVDTNRTVEKVNRIKINTDTKRIIRKTVNVNYDTLRRLKGSQEASEYIYSYLVPRKTSISKTIY